MAMSAMGEVWGLKVLVVEPVRMSTTRTDKLRDAITAVRESGATAIAVMGSPSCDSDGPAVRGQGLGSVHSMTCT